MKVLRFNQVIIKKILLQKEFISILPELGARLNAAHLIANENLIPVLKNLRMLIFKTNDEMFNNAKLFPFAGRIRERCLFFSKSNSSISLNYSEEEKILVMVFVSRKNLM